MKRTTWLVLICATAIMLPVLFIVPTGHAVPTDQTGQNARTETHGLNPADMDPTCKPCEDFYNFVNGGWAKTHPIPPAFASYGHFTELQDHNQEALHQILDEAAGSKSAKPGSVEQKIGDFYSSCMDTAQSDAAGIHPLDDELARICNRRRSRRCC